MRRDFQRARFPSERAREYQSPKIARASRLACVNALFQRIFTRRKSNIELLERFMNRNTPCGLFRDKRRRQSNVVAVDRPRSQFSTRYSYIPIHRGDCWLIAQHIRYHASHTRRTCFHERDRQETRTYDNRNSSLTPYE